MSHCCAVPARDRSAARRTSAGDAAPRFAMAAARRAAPTGDRGRRADRTTSATPARPSLRAGGGGPRQKRRRDPLERTTAPAGNANVPTPTRSRSARRARSRPRWMSATPAMAGYASASMTSALASQRWTMPSPIMATGHISSSHDVRVYAGSDQREGAAMTRSAPEDEGKRREPPRHSASAEAGALRREEAQPVDRQAPPPAAGRQASPPQPGDRHSASAEAAALRWRERHEDDEDD
jgi:hypothetical protein